MVTEWVEWFRQAPKWLVVSLSAANLVVGGVGAALWTDYNGFRAEQTKSANATLDAVKDADQELTGLLIKFAKLALDEGDVSSEDRAELDRIVNKANQKASEVATAFPTLRSVYLLYSDSLIALKKASDRLKSSRSGKEFVKAVANYSIARDKFRDESQQVSSRYLSTFRF